MTARSQLVVGILAVAVAVAGCGTANASPTPSASPAATAARASATVPFSTPSSSVSSGSGGSKSQAPSGSAAASSGSPGPSASPAPRCISIGLSHADPVLEAFLPCTIGGIDLERFSLPLSQYIASSSGGDRGLYAPWLVGFALTPEEVNMAVVADLSLQENFVIHAIKVPGVDDAKLSSSFAEQAKQAGWPVTSKTVTGHPLLEMTDPAAKATGALSVGYVFAKNHVLYTIITDDPSLLVEALIKLP